MFKNSSNLKWILRRKNTVIAVVMYVGFYEGGVVIHAVTYCSTHSYPRHKMKVNSLLNAFVVFPKKKSNPDPLIIRLVTTE